MPVWNIFSPTRLMRADWFLIAVNILYFYTFSHRFESHEYQFNVSHLGRVARCNGIFIEHRTSPCCCSDMAELCVWALKSIERAMKFYLNRWFEFQRPRERPCVDERTLVDSSLFSLIAHMIWREWDRLDDDEESKLPMQIFVELQVDIISKLRRQHGWIHTQNSLSVYMARINWCYRQIAPTAISR